MTNYTASKVEEELTWSISAKELYKINMELWYGHYNSLFENLGLSVGHLREMVMDVSYNPSNYTELREMIDDYNLQHRKQEQQRAQYKK